MSGFTSYELDEDVQPDGSALSSALLGSLCITSSVDGRLMYTEALTSTGEAAASTAFIKSC
jgi:hypothetical protein